MEQDKLNDETLKQDEKIGWDDVQDEMKESANPVAEKEGEEIGWDDVQDEMEKSTNPVEKKEINSVKFDEIQKSETNNTSLDLDFIMDIPLALTVELGRSKMLIGELLQLNQGSVIELEKLAGEPMDVFANDRLIARGEVVVVNEKFGIRLTDVISLTERVDKLK